MTSEIMELADRVIAKTYKRFPLVLEKGSGCTVFDTRGRSYTDFVAGIAVCKALGADPWGVLASGTLLAAFPERLADQALHALTADGHATAVIARAVRGTGVERTDGARFVRYERDELSRILS